MTQFITSVELSRIQHCLNSRMCTGLRTKGGSGATVYGSCRDGTANPLGAGKDDDMELDIDSMINHGFLSEEKLNQCLHYIENTPGYVQIDVTDMPEAQYKQCFPYPSLDVKLKNGRKYLSAQKLKGILNAELKSSDEMLMYLSTSLDNRLPVDPSSAAASTRVKGGHGFNLHYDDVVSVACVGWPLSASSWGQRSPRYWPEQRSVEDVTNAVYHLVSKPSSSGDPETEWRLSFSFAESKLMDTIRGPRLATYKILKDLIVENAKLRETNVLKTYFLKSVFFWVCEKQPEDFWNMYRIDKCVLSLLESLIHGFQTGLIQHYFIPEINLLEDIPKEALSATTDELIHIRTDLQISYFTPNPVIEGLAMMELAWLKQEYESTLKQLKKIEKNASRDHRYIMKAVLRLLSEILSYVSSTLCIAEKMKLLDKTQLWYIEETLSCTYAFMSACAEKINSWSVAYEDLHEMVEVFCEPRELSATERRIRDIELPHGQYRSVFEDQEKYPKDTGPLRSQFRIVAEYVFKQSMKLTLSYVEVLKISANLNDQILYQMESKEAWDINKLVDAIKPVIPNFKWNSEGHLSIHQLAQEGVWRFQIPFDILVEQKNIRSLSFEGCQGDCFRKGVNLAKEILFGVETDPKINIFNVSYRGSNAIYAELEKLKSVGVIEMLSKLQNKEDVPAKQT